MKEIIWCLDYFRLNKKTCFLYTNNNFTVVDSQGHSDINVTSSLVGR